MKVVKSLAVFAAVIAALVSIGLIYGPLDVRTGQSTSSETISERETGSPASGESDLGIRAPGDPNESGEDDQGDENRSSLRWEEIEDVDALARSLAEALEAGDGQAGWKLHRLAATCLKSHLVPAEIPVERQNRMNPEQLAEVQARLDRLNTMKGPCEDSSLGDMGYARSVKQEALWEAAQSGHLDAQYRLVFTSYMPGNEPMPSADDEDITWQTVRRNMLEELRDACHDRALASIGIHLSRDSDVANGLVRESLQGHGASKSRQIQAFSHRYAAALLRDEAQPAQSARNSDYPLTAHEEGQAVEMAESIVADCD